ncbi:hypothetical protein Cs7R123_51800 [Catellatospora sp. TT07R-123]|uniref:cellulose binding domain-containing protein n=1 Tax=Catellatospora sp. TT07R-123 TaxID=2733863 RepID=UPI001B0CD6E2|nr:cellulose binding domain-containing protein [Catellatospora sp. TT07R-123]GHJ47838.1 hypothetical protein Cs7R123_51800 [Catellatospora sp. TT07R-123]
MRRTIAAAVTLLAVALPAPASAEPAVTCVYTFTAYPNGFTATIDIRNQGPRLDSWSLRWTVPDGTQLGNAWAARMTQPTPLELTAVNQPWNGTVASGGRISFGWTAVAPTATTPTDITVNGTRC